MAKAKVVKREVEKTFVKKVTEKTVVLELTETEAIVLRTITRHISGMTPERHIMSHIGFSLRDAGIGYLSADQVHDERAFGGRYDGKLGTTWFHEGKMFLFPASGAPGVAQEWKIKDVDPFTGE